MEPGAIDEFSLLSSSSDTDSTIIIDEFGEDFSNNPDNKQNKRNNDLKSMMYDLGELEDSYDKTETSTSSKGRSQDILKELSQKYLYCNSSDLSVKRENIILLSDSSSEENSDKFHNQFVEKTYSLVEDLIPSFKGKNSLDVQLDKNNSIFEKYICDVEQIENIELLEENEVIPRKRSSEEENCANTPSKVQKPHSHSANRKKIGIVNEKKLAAEEKKALKKIERLKKREQIEKEKASQQSQKMLDKCNKPEECLKYIIVNMDHSLYNNTVYGDYLKQHFENTGVSYRLTTSLPGILSWSRRLLRIEILETKETEMEEKHYVAIIQPGAFENLLTCIQSIKEKTQFEHLSIVVYGQSKPTTVQEDIIMNIEMLFPTFWQFVTNKEELGSIIFMLTKSISQIPYKLQQEEKYKHHSEYFDDSNKNLVKVDKNGNGLGRLWRQMLTMFPLVRLEAAEAICTAYPTPASLFEAYELSTDKEKLIQDLAIRRAQGPLTAIRRLGPELSKKCYKFFTSEENILL